MMMILIIYGLKTESDFNSSLLHERDHNSFPISALSSDIHSTPWKVLPDARQKVSETRCES